MARVRNVESLERRWLLAGDHFPLAGLPQKPWGEVAQIVGGQPSEPARYPWMTSLQRNGRHFCGGILVGPDAVLTAAHCVEGGTVGDLQAVVGTTDLRSEQGTTAPVAHVITHPAYDPITNDADIAVLLLGQTVDDVPLPLLEAHDTQRAAPGTTARILGWGTTREGGNTSSLLQTADVPIVSSETANQLVSYAGLITANMLPAGFEEGGIDSCQGDSGGPLLVDHLGDTPRLAGIVSWGEGCGRPLKYGIYTRVSRFTQWVDSVVHVDRTAEVEFSQDRYIAGAVARIILQDEDLAGRAMAEVTVAADTGDRQTVQLTALSPGRFVGEVRLSTTPGTLGNGHLNLGNAETIEVTYFDETDNLGISRQVRDRARIVRDDVGNSAADALAIEVGATTHGEIEVSGDEDWFRIDANDDQTYRIAVHIGGTLNDSLLTIFDASGDVILGFDDDSGRGLGSELLFRPPEAGSYLVVVSGYGSHVGTYALELETVLAPPDDHGDILGTATKVGIPSSNAGQLEITGDADWFAFQAEEGVLYTIETELDTLTDSRLRLLDSDGRSELAYNDDASPTDLSSQITYRAASSGTKYVEVAGFAGATGRYTLKLSAAHDDHADTPEQPTPLPQVGNTFTARGHLAPRDIDWFSFPARPDTHYEIRTQLETLDDTIVELIGPDGEFRARNDDHELSLASRIVWQTALGAEYRIGVSAFGNATGTYGLTVRALEPPPQDDYGNRAELAGRIDVPNVRLGEIQYEADVDWLAFSAIAGVTYSFEVQLQSLTDSKLAIYSRDGSLLAENDDQDFPDRSSRLDWTAADSGTAYVAVSAFDGFLGTYRLVADKTSRRGDTNLDGLIDARDIDRLYAAIAANSSEATFDLNGDKKVNTQDLTVLVESILGTTAGDTDLDGVVDFRDFLRVSQSFSRQGGWEDGDFDGNGRIDFHDFLSLAEHFSQLTADTPSADAPSADAV